MFKKRGNNSKKIDLSKEAEHISTQEIPKQQEPELSQELLSNQARTPMGRPRPKGNSITL